MLRISRRISLPCRVNKDYTTSCNHSTPRNVFVYKSNSRRNAPNLRRRQRCIVVPKQIIILALRLCEKKRNVRWWQPRREVAIGPKPKKQKSRKWTPIIENRCVIGLISFGSSRARDCRHFDMRHGMVWVKNGGDEMIGFRNGNLMEFEFEWLGIENDA